MRAFAPPAVPDAQVVGLETSTPTPSPLPPAPPPPPLSPPQEDVISQVAIPVPTLMPPAANAEPCENPRASRAELCFDPMRMSWHDIPEDTVHIDIHWEYTTLGQRFSYSVPPTPRVFVFPPEIANRKGGSGGYACYASKEFIAHIFAVTPTHQQRLNGMGGIGECDMRGELPVSTPLEQAVKSTFDDRRKQPFQGELGPFEVAGTPDGKQRNLSCASFRSHFGSPGEPSDTIMNRRGSPLFLRDGVIERIESCNWEVTWGRQLPGTSVVERGYFDRERVLVLETAPEDRLRLTEIEGRPALGVLPIPGQFLSQSRLVVIQTPASAGKPGLFLSVETQDGPDSAREIVRSVLGAG